MTEKKGTLVWLDLETTGLSETNDDILEVGVVITDDKLQVCAEYESLVSGSLKKCNEFVANMHAESGLIDRLADDKIYKSPIHSVGEDLKLLIKEHCEDKVAVLAGNTVQFDQRFLRAKVPSVLEVLSHRLLDVSTIRRAFRMRSNGAVEGAKPPCTHRALDDVYTAMQEYKQLFDEYDQWVKSN